MFLYPKIQTVFKRDPATKHRTLLEGQFACPEFEYLKDCAWTLTEKVDGTNIRVLWEGGKVRFGGKSDNAQIPAPLIARLQDLFPVGKFERLFYALRDEGIPMCLCGEGYGAKIQKGGDKYHPHGPDFVLFDVRIGDTWLERHNVEDIAGKLCIDVVPHLHPGSLLDAVEMTRIGFHSKWGSFTAEGLVMRPATELQTRMGKRIITKIKHKDFRPVGDESYVGGEGRSRDIIGM